MGIDGIVLAFARETKVLTEETNTKLTKENPQLREWVDMNLETLESLTDEDYLALRCTGAGTAAVRALDDFTRATVGSKEYEAALGHLNAFEDALMTISEAAYKKGIRILIDAESSIHQPAIDHVALVSCVCLRSAIQTHANGFGVIGCHGQVQQERPGYCLQYISNAR